MPRHGVMIQSVPTVTVPLAVGPFPLIIGPSFFYGGRLPIEAGSAIPASYHPPKGSFFKEMAFSWPATKEHPFVLIAPWLPHRCPECVPLRADSAPLL
jgi:hypothetical protein